MPPELKDYHLRQSWCWIIGALVVSGAMAASALGIDGPGSFVFITSAIGVLGALIAAGEKLATEK